MEAIWPKARPYIFGGTSLFVIYVFYILGWGYYGAEAMQPIDDFHGYLHLIRYVAETGRLMTDRFNDSAIISSLGGQYYWKALFYILYGWKGTMLADPAVPFLIMMLMVLWRSWRAKDERAQAWGITLVILFCLSMPFFGFQVIGHNNAAVLTPIPGLLALILFAYQSPKQVWLWFAAGILIGVTLSLKNTVLAYMGMLGFVFLYHQWEQGYLFDRSRWLAYVAMIVGASLVLAPMMWHSYRSFTTFWYPYLGKGTHISGTLINYAQIAGIYSLDGLVGGLIDSFSEPYIYLAIGVLGAQALQFRSIWPALFGGIAYANLLLVGYGTGNTETMRYAMQPFMVAILVTPMLHSYGAKQTLILKQLAFVIAGFIVPVVFVTVMPSINKFHKFPTIPSRTRLKIVLSLQGPWQWELTKEYATLQQHLPKDGRGLLFVERPFLLDLSGDNMEVLHNPGYVSPAPHWINQHSPEALTAYLKQQGISWFVYDYKRKAGFDVFVDFYHEALRKEREQGIKHYLKPWILHLLKQDDAGVTYCEWLKANKPIIYRDDHFVIVKL